MLAITPQFLDAMLSIIHKDLFSYSSFIYKCCGYVTPICLCVCCVCDDRITCVLYGSIWYCRWFWHGI